MAGRHHKAVALVAALLGAAPAAIRSAAAPPAVTLAIAGRANATPSVAAIDQFVAVAWGATHPGGGTDVYAAVSRDGARAFGAPVRVNTVEGSAALGLEQPPRLSLVPRAGHDPSIVVVWTAKSKDGTRVLTARSDAGGAAFATATIVAASEAGGNRGWVSTAVDRAGRVVALWLDHRETASTRSAAPMTHEGHDHAATMAAKADGAARAQLSKLWFAAVDGSAAQAITGGVCYCCKTALATGPDGAIYGAWRHVYPGNIRDIAFTMSKDGGRTFTAPARVSDDHWVLDGCPENGPAIAVAADSAVHVLWPTLVPGATADAEPALALFHAVTHDGGRTFTPRQRVTTGGTPRHPQLLVTARGLVASWDEEMPGGNRRVVLGRAMPGNAREVVSAARAQTPSLAAAGDAVIVAWTEGGQDAVVRVERR